MAANSFRSALALLFGACVSFAISAQTLARPGWAGSGLNGEPWWKSAVFYRVDPRTFQDSDGDGMGDLPGLTSRLDYLQTLGVDALILAQNTSASSALPFAVLDEPGFDELIVEASRRHLRVVVAQNYGRKAASFLPRARLALTRGVAGIEVVSPGPLPVSATTSAQTPLPLATLRSLAASFPGERVVLSFEPGSENPLNGAHAVRRGAALHLGAGGEAPELVLLPVSAQTRDETTTAAGVRALVAAADVLRAGASPLLGSTGLSPTALPVFPALLAVRLLTLRGAISLDAGQELGLPSTVDSGAAGSAGHETETTQAFIPMQWTPRNITPPDVKIEPSPEPTPIPTRSDVYGAYRPYVPVKPKPVVLPGTPPPPPDPNSLPGFTSGSLPVSTSPALDTAHRNVATEDLDPRSVLNLYRRLIALHHGHATLRTGSTAVLDPSASGAAVWVRRAPAGARTVASVVVACNLSDGPVTLSLDAELVKARIRPGLLRPLLGNVDVPTGPQSTAHLSLAAQSVYIGEIYHH